MNKDKIFAQWEKHKGKVAVMAISTILGLTAVTQFLGIELVEVDGMMCFTEAAVEAVVVEVAPVVE